MARWIVVLVAVWFGVTGLAQSAMAPAAEGAAPGLLSNGGFEADANGDGTPDGWPTGDGWSFETEGGARFLRLRANPEKMLTVYRMVNVRPEHRAYRLSFRVRFAGIERGKAQWHDGRIVLDFKDAEGKKVPGSPGAPFFNKGTRDWHERTIDFLVPEGAKTLEVMPAMFQVKAGTLDIDDLVLVATDPAPIVARLEQDRIKREQETARLAAAVKAKVPPVPAEKLPSELRVVGNQIQNAKGEMVWLQGLAIASMEWTAGGENILKSVEVGIKDWKANCIRLPIREHFWIGKGPYQRDGGAAYRQLVEDAVNLAASHGAYTLLDLHRFRAPNEADVAFWKDVAQRYKNHPAVLFDLFNEPHDVSWAVWKDGGVVTDRKVETNALAENKEKLTTFTALGMQDLIDTVREAGAKNIVIVGGLDWGYDLSGVLQGYALDDRNGNGIMYSSHVYPWKSDWQGKFLDVAAKYPIFIGECGGEVERMSFIPPEQHEDPYTWSPDMLGLIQKHKLHWTGWCFHNKSSPRLILDWDYTPTPFWGQFVKDALAGKQFEVKRLR